ncbi:hypothetical protein LCGC14_3029100, partial [marine sediment metagenome]
SNIIILENESLVYAHTIGDVQIAPEIIRVGLENFPKNVMYYWYPSVSSYLLERRVRQRELCQIVAEVLPNVRFIDSNRSRYSTIFRDFQREALRDNNGLNNNSLVSIVHVYPSQQYWQNDRVEQVLSDLLADKEAILYPGQAGFIEQGRVFSQLLPKRRQGTAQPPSE